MEPLRPELRLSSRNARRCGSWLLFIATALLYAYCREASTSYWDCSEFIASAWHLQNPHPPGAPLFLMLGHLFMVFGGSAQRAAQALNLLSALASAATVSFVFEIVWMLAERMLGTPEQGASTLSRSGPLFIACSTGALVLAFSTSFWFSAVEAEVYALSMGFSSLLVYVLLRGLLEPGSWRFSRWMLLASLLFGLSFGVHPMSLLLVPLFVLAPYLRTRQPKAWKAIMWLILGLGGVYLFFAQLLPGLLALSAAVDRWAVNQLGAPVWSFWVGFWVILGSCLWVLSTWARRRNLPRLQTLLLAAVLFLLGASSYLEVPIRAWSGPAINLGQVSDPYALEAYLLRTEYAAAPLLLGAPFNVQAVAYRTGDVRYHYDDSSRHYTSTPQTYVPVYPVDSMRLFPRLWDHDSRAVDFYRSWLKLRPGEPSTRLDGLYFTLSYQLDWMDLRYVMWNLVGRQNDRQGFGNARDGNWISGIAPLDHLHVLDHPGPHPEPGSHRYAALPLLLVLLGIFLQFRRDKRMAWLTAALFVAGNVALALALNLSGPQARERDYVFLVGDLALAVWAGLGALWYLERPWVRKHSWVWWLPLVIPAWMACSNLHDHNRHDLHLAADMGHNLLSSCPPHAILLVEADNDTYPLWYQQEVLGYRRDVRVVNTSLLNLPGSYRELASAAPAGGPLEPGAWFRNGAPELARVVPKTAEADSMQPSLEDILGQLSHHTTLDSRGLGILDSWPDQPLGLYVHGQRWGSVQPEGPYLSRADLLELSLLASQLGHRPICLSQKDLLASLHLQANLAPKGLIWQLCPQTDSSYLSSSQLLVQAHMLLDSLRFGGVESGTYVDQQERSQVRRILNACTRCALALEHVGMTLQARQLLSHVADRLSPESLPVAEPSPHNKVDAEATRFALACYLAQDSSRANRITKAILEDLDNQMRAALNAPPYLLDSGILQDIQRGNALSATLRGYQRLYGGYGPSPNYLKNWPTQHQHLLNQAP